MIAHGFNSLCKQSELYYYDFIFDKNEMPVPEFIVDHIKQCQHCREQINQLNKVLSQTEGYVEPEQQQACRATTNILKLHFAYIGGPVNCEIVKPFLPSLSKIRIPTPITAHLDNCQQCSEDLEKIRQLDLSRKQLHQLSQLFADNSAVDNVSCTKAQEAIPSVVSMVFNEIDSKILKHLCTCPDCIELLHQHREKTLLGLLRTSSVQDEFPCDRVSPRDFFDYVIPYGIDPNNDQYVKFRESLISHLRTCPDCLAKMQELHRTVYGIYERGNSDVVTIYQINESAKTKTAGEAERFYADFPIRVDVKHRKEAETKQSIPAIDFTAIPKHKVRTKKFKPILKSGAIATAAAVIFIAVILLRNVPTAGASALEKMYDAVVKIENVHIASFITGEKEPIQERWISRTLNIYIMKTAEKYVLWDIADDVKKTKYLGTGTTETNRLTAGNIISIEKEMRGALGLMPFYSISGIPENSDWSQVASEALGTYNKDIEVYDLMWTEEGYDGSLIFNKWRFFVDSETNLPKRTEFYQKLPPEDEYILISTKEIEYLSTIEMQTIIEEVSF